MLIKDKQIAIIGGGPGGLTLARLLQMNGANVKVYERDFNENVRVQGATLDLHMESGLEALRRAGLTDAFYANYRPDAGRLRILNKHLGIEMDTHSAENYDEHRPEIDRGPLRNILLGSLEPGTVMWDSQFATMSEKDNRWNIRFKNGTEAVADLVIACDGANSKVRPYINSTKLIYSGVTAVEGNIYNGEKHAPKLYALVNGGKIFAFGDERSLILSAKGDGTLSFYTGCKVDESWTSNSGIDFKNKEQVFEWFKKEFAEWSTEWHELFLNDEVAIVPRPQYYYPLDQQWETVPGLTMIGDAAHLMPPYAGEGVNMAMQDAFELAEILLSDNYPDVNSGIAAFEKQMCVRASEVTQMTLQSTALLHSEDPIPKLVNLFSGIDDGF